MMGEKSKENINIFLNVLWFFSYMKLIFQVRTYPLDLEKI